MHDGECRHERNALCFVHTRPLCCYCCIDLCAHSTHALTCACRHICIRNATTWCNCRARTLSQTHTHNNTIDLEWKVLYVGSAHDSHQDQVLDEILVGPVPVGLNKFVLQADPPALDQLPAEELLGVTVILVTCSYKEREFVRVGYYVNNEYMLQEGEAEVPSPQNMDMTKVQRQILADKPRVTKFPIPWGSSSGGEGDAMASGNEENTMANPMPSAQVSEQKLPPAGVAPMESTDMEM